MSATLSRSDTWAEANQRLLVAELARIKALLSGEGQAEALRRIETARAGLPAPAAIDQLSACFDLSGFERDLLLLAAGVELEAEIGALCAQAAGGQPRPWASFALGLAVLGEPHWSALTPGRPLLHWRLLERLEDGALVAGRLRIDERVLHLLAGINEPDARLLPLLTPLTASDVMAPSQALLAERIADGLGRHREAPPLIELTGPDGSGKREVAAAVAAALGRRLYVLAAAEIPAHPQEREALLRLWERETLLLQAGLLVEAPEAETPAVARPFLERLGGLALLACPETQQLLRPVVRHRVERPAPAEQVHLWRQALGGAAEDRTADLGAVAAEFRFSARQIGEMARELADGGGDLWQACRGQDRLRIGGLAQRIEPAARWEELILPEPQLETLRRIAAQMRHRFTVHDTWGFATRGSRGLGLSVLFTGESGTGKTMAAEVLAEDLQLDLYRIDLAAVVSKYIGETEKNLALVFDAAEDSGVILLFDEADALFGKRSEVKDSHDRHANIEVSYLLQRMEAYRGLAILTTNQKAALDPAFQRRLRFVVTFPFPDMEQREALWRRVFPAATPLAAIDTSQLARLQMSGGHIRNIALNAAFLAAEAGESVGMAHLLAATRSEASKRERPLADAEIRGWT